MCVLFDVDMNIVLNVTINNYKSLENKFNVYSYDFEIQYDICELVYKWCEASNEKECNVIFDELEYWGIFLGDFIKSLLIVYFIRF